MKILLFAQLPPPVHGASAMNQKATDIFLKNFDKIEIINLTSATSLDDIDRISIRKILSIFNLLVTIIRACFKNPDLVYFSFCPNGFAFYRDVLIAVILRTFRIKHVFHLHGQGLKTGGKIKYFLAQIAFKKAHVIHLSSVFWKEVEGLIPKKRFYVVPNCAENLYENKLSHTNKLLNEPIKILYLSNYIRGKGPLYVLDLAEALWERKINCEIYMAGGWFDLKLKKEIMERIDEHSKLIKSGFLTVSGPVDGDEKKALFNDCDIFLFPSYIDTFPLVIVEALSTGMAIVASDTGAVREILDDGNAGMIFPEHDFNTMVDLIVNLTGNPESRHLLSSRATSHYEEHYTKPVFEKSLIETIKKII